MDTLRKRISEKLGFDPVNAVTNGIKMGLISLPTMEEQEEKPLYLVGKRAVARYLGISDFLAEAFLASLEPFATRSNYKVYLTEEIEQKYASWNKSS